MASNKCLSSELQDRDPIDLCIDSLYEKSSAKKIHGLTGLVHLLSSEVMQDACILRDATLSNMFCNFVRRGRLKESLLAARGLSLLLVTLGRNEFSSRVWKNIKCELDFSLLSGKSPDLKSAVIEAWALGCFVAEDDIFEIQSTMRKFQALWKTPSQKVVASAVKGWTLNLSSLSERFVTSLELEQAAVQLCQLLEPGALEVQESAGTALLLLYDMNPELGEEGAAVGLADSDADSSCGSISTTMSQLSMMDEAKDKMKDLSIAKSDKQRISKKQKAQTKATFREIYNFMEDGEFREEKIKLQYGDTLVLSSLKMQIQMKFIRSLLTHGFHRHLHENEFLHEVFDFKPHDSPAAKMTTSEKRYYKSPSSWSSKFRTRTRDLDRAQKEIYLQGGSNY